MRKTNKYKKIIFIMLIASMAGESLFSATVKEMDREAQALFDKRDYNQAVGIWLAALEIDPDNERIQQKIELVYEIKQKKDMSFQKSRLNYRIARKKMKEESDKDIQRGIAIGKTAVDDFIYAFKIDPNDDELKKTMDDMKNLEAEIKAAEEKIRLSQEKREKIERLKIEVRNEMKQADPDYQKSLRIWKEILSLVPKDNEALEGKRKCDFAIENRIKFEKIRTYLTKGIDLFNKKDYKLAKLEFEEVLKIDQRHREAKDYIEKINEIIEETTLFAQRTQQAENFYKSGINNIANNRFSEAQEDFESALALIKNYKDAKDRLKDIDRLRKEYEQKETAKRLDRLNQKFQEGLVAYTQGKYKEAIDAFVVTLTIDKKNQRASEYLQRSRDALRLQEEETVDENSPYYDVINSFAVAGIGLYNKGNFSESRKRWEGILKLFPKNKTAREYIIKCDLMINPQSRETLVKEKIFEGKTFLEKKDYRNALRTFNLIKTIDKNYPGIDNLIAQAAAGKKEDEAPDVNPTDRAEINRRYQAGMNLYQQGGKENIEKALGLFRWVVQKDPGNIKAVITVNKIESQLRIGAGEADRKQMLTDKQRELVNKYYYNGINYYSNNNFQRAIQEWRKVLAIDPGNIKARNNIRKVMAFMER